MHVGYVEYESLKIWETTLKIVFASKILRFVEIILQTDTAHTWIIPSKRASTSQVLASTTNSANRT